MAKLDVKVIDMVAGEVTKVAYEGAEYERVEGKAQEGDIVMNVSDDDNDLTIGAYYEVERVDSDGDFEITDDIDDSNWLYPHHAKSFRKVSASKTPIESRVDALERDVAELKGGNQPKLKVGDYAKVVQSLRGNEGMIVTIEPAGDYIFKPSNLVIKSVKDGAMFQTPPSWLVQSTDEEVAAAKAQLEPRVGDTLKGGGIVIAVRAQTNPLMPSQSYISAEKGLTYIKNGMHLWNHIESAEVEKRGTQADADRAIAEYKAEAERKKWAEIGRKPNEFKKGDIVRGEYIHGENVVVAGVVEDVSNGLLGVIRFGDNTYCAVRNSELITPVERRFDV